MESPASAAGPRVYVPITHPDSPVPTYAVLQFLGFSPPPDPKQSPILHTHFAPPATPPPAAKLLPCTSLSPVSNPASPAPKHGTASSTDSSSNSSVDERDKKPTSIKPVSMKKSASGGNLAPVLSPGARRNRKSLPFGATISISHTDKDTIIHTHSSNFREVVHQLTGATSGGKDLMPVTMPSRTVIRGGTANSDKDALPMAAPMRTIVQNEPESNQIITKQEAFGVPTLLCITSPKPIETGCISRRPIGSTAKLLERRKSNKVLERLSTSCRNLPPLVPSPVTPLASDFEKIFLPVTPTTSEASSAAAVTPAASATVRSGDAKAMELLSAPILTHETILHTDGAEAMEGISVEGKAFEDIGDATDVQGPCVVRVKRTDSLSLHDGMDVQVPSAPHTAVMRASRLADAMDVQGPSSIGVLGRRGLRLADDMDVQHGVVMRERRSHDAMDAQGQRVCNSAGLQRLSPTMSAGKDSNLVQDEEFIIAKKGFFFHSQKPRHGDPTLLHLFPESPREL